MRILVIHQYYLLPGQPGSSRFNEMTRLWHEAGHDVEVITGTVNYATGVRPPEYAGRLVTREDDAGVTVWRCQVPRSYTRGYIGRAWAFAGFVLSGMAAVPRTARADVVLATSPPLVVALLGFVAALRHRCPFVFEVRDLWPESAITTGVLSARGPLARILYAMERWVYGRCSLINVLTPAFRDDIVRRGLAPSSKIVFVPNGADASAFTPGPRDNAVRVRLGWGSRTVALYAGAHGRANALTQLIDAAQALRDRPDILMATVGDGPERTALEEETRRRGLTNLMFLGAVAKTEMPEIVRAADIGLAVLQRNDTFKTVYPNKVFDYMACERPTVLAIDGVARALVCEAADAGVFGEPEDGPALARTIAAMADAPDERARLGRNGRRWVVANATREALAARYLEHLRDLVASGARVTFYRGAPKRALDLVLALVMLVVLSPVLLLTALAVRWSIGTPVLFRQSRPGRAGRLFTLFKFRTMTEARDPDGRLRPDDERLTRVGRLLRATSLDELPELWNVLVGEMSLIGPRPLLPQYLARYTLAQARRHEVKPGVTGWAQVNGRNALTWERKFELDVWYVDHLSFALDVRILLMTIRSLITREGISEPGHATAREFVGSGKSAE